MSAVVALARAELRRAWRSLLLIGLLAGFVGATVIGSLALARRTTTAYERLSQATGMDDARGLVVHHLDLIDEIVRLPAVTAHWTGRMSIAQVDGEQNFLGIVAGPEAPSPLYRPLVLEGRLPRDDGDPATAEIALRDDFQREVHLPLGTEIPVRFLSEADYFRFDTGFTGGHANGPEMTLRVVGTVRLAGGFGSVPPGLGGPDLLQEPDLAIGGAYFVRLQDGQRSFDEFAEAAAALAATRDLPPEADEFSVLEVTDPTKASAAVDHTASLLGRALLAVALAAGGAGLVTLVQLCARHNSARAGAQEVAVALGLTRRERVLVRIGVAALPAGVAVTVAFGGAVLASGIRPIGAILDYETRTGAVLNRALVATGVALVGSVVVAACVAAGAGRPSGATVGPLRVSHLAERTSRLGAAVETVIGLRFALEPGHGRRIVPVRGALLGVVIGVAGVVGGLVFSTSLDRLLSEPARSAVLYDVLVSDVTDAGLVDILEHPLAGDVTTIESSSVRMGDASVMAYAYTDRRGELELDLADGRLPTAPDEILVGLRLAGDLDLEAGDTVRVSGPDGEEHLLVVAGTGVIPPLNGEDLGLSVVLSSDGLAHLEEAEPFVSAAVGARPGADPDELAASLAEAFEAHDPVPPIELENLGRLGALPDLAAAAIGLVAVLALTHALAVVVRRRAGDLALLRAVGCSGRQTGTAIVVMALTITILGVGIGTPLGLAIGSTLWRMTAEGAFVTPDPSWPWAQVAFVAVVVVAVGLLAALLPARRASQLPPAALLRAE